MEALLGFSVNMEKILGLGFRALAYRCWRGGGGVRSESGA